MPRTFTLPSEKRLPSRKDIRMSEYHTPTKSQHAPMAVFVSDYKIHQPTRTKAGKMKRGRMTIKFDVIGGDYSAEKYQRILDAIRAVLPSLER